jgi:hypothetical protein
VVDAGDLANIATALAVIVALVIGLVQINQFNRKRRDLAAIESVRSIQTAEFRDGFELVWPLPEGLTAEQLRARGPDLERAIFTLGFTFENLGVMVFEGILPITTVDRLIGGLVRDSWRKTRPFWEAKRAEFGSKNVGEWYQWLAEQLEAHPAPGKREGAYAAHRAWQP